MSRAILKQIHANNKIFESIRISQFAATNRILESTRMLPFDAMSRILEATKSPFQDIHARTALLDNVFNGYNSILQQTYTQLNAAVVKPYELYGKAFESVFAQMNLANSAAVRAAMPAFDRFHNTFADLQQTIQHLRPELLEVELPETLASPLEDAASLFIDQPVIESVRREEAIQDIDVSEAPTTEKKWTVKTVLNLLFILYQLAWPVYEHIGDTHFQNQSLQNDQAIISELQEQNRLSQERNQLLEKQNGLLEEFVYFCKGIIDPGIENHEIVDDSAKVS